MRHLKFVRYGDKFSAIPITGSGLHSNPVDNGCYEEYQPARYIVQFFKRKDVTNSPYEEKKLKNLLLLVSVAFSIA